MWIMKGAAMSEDDYEFPVIEDHTEDVAVTLAVKNRERYESQAKKFLEDSYLEVHIYDAILRYTYKRNLIQSELSYDEGKSFRWLQGSRLVPGDDFNETQVFWEFAWSEARALLER